MKTNQSILAALLCVSSLTFAPCAWSEDAVSRSVGAPAVSAPMKTVWPTCKMPVHRSNAHGVPNFGKLNDNIWRSGQPSREGYQNLAKEGLKTVVNLREEFPQDKDLLPKGVRYVYIPIKDEHAPTEAQAKQFMEVASNPDNWPLLVHCAGGQGRAGVMSGLVRSTLDGWNMDSIMKEVGNFRTRYLGFISIPMASCQRNFLQQWEEARSIAPKDTSAKDPGVKDVGVKDAASEKQQNPLEGSNLGTVK